MIRTFFAQHFAAPMKFAITVLLDRLVVRKVAAIAAHLVAIADAVRTVADFADASRHAERAQVRRRVAKRRRHLKVHQVGLADVAKAHSGVVVGRIAVTKVFGPVEFTFQVISDVAHVRGRLPAGLHLATARDAVALAHFGDRLLYGLKKECAVQGYCNTVTQHNSIL